MKAFACAVLGCLAFVASPLWAQDEGGSEIIVTGTRMSRFPGAVVDSPVSLR